MSVSSEITRLENAKAAIAAAIAEKGVTVPDGTLLDGMAELVGGIETGGGVISGTIIPAESAVQTITHNLGRVPSGIAIITTGPYGSSTDGVFIAFGDQEKQGGHSVLYKKPVGSTIDVGISATSWSGTNPCIANANEQTFESALFSLVYPNAFGYLYVGAEYRWYVW